MDGQAIIMERERAATKCARGCEPKRVRFVGTYRHFNRRAAAIVVLETDTDFAIDDELKVAADDIAMMACALNVSSVASLLMVERYGEEETIAEQLASLSKRYGEDIKLIDVKVVM